MTYVSLNNITYYADQPLSVPRVVQPDTPQSNVTDEQLVAQKIIDDLSLRIRSGETISLLGPSGCGKTTLLKIIAGLVVPSSGTVHYDAEDLRTIPNAERGIGMVFQSYALYPHMTARTNIGFFDLIRKQPEKIDERIRHVSKVMGVSIKHLLSRKPPTLSGGERQRVAMARALARDPRIFLFDEPLSNLDAKLRTSTRTQLKRLLEHYKITSVYVTHDQVEAIALAHRIAIMDKGQIVQLGTYKDIYERPQTRFVADFFGTPSMNLYVGRVKDQRWEGQHFAVAPLKIDYHSRVWIGIRPEDVNVSDTGIEAIVEFIEPLFAERVNLVTLNIRQETCVVRVPIEQEMHMGMHVHVQFPIDRLHLFDARTNTRIEPDEH